jgi:hypothetical protein
LLASPWIIVGPALLVAASHIGVVLLMSPLMNIPVAASAAVHGGNAVVAVDRAAVAVVANEDTLGLDGASTGVVSTDGGGGILDAQASRLGN